MKGEEGLRTTWPDTGEAGDLGKRGGARGGTQKHEVVGSRRVARKPERQGHEPGDDFPSFIKEGVQ